MDKAAILYIDDEEGDGLLMQMYMADHGIDVDISRYSSVGITMFRPRRHTLVVIDWNLMDVPGPEVARQLRAKHKNVPIVFLSGAYTEDRLKQAAAYDPLACLEKTTSMDYMEKIARLAAPREHAA